MMLKGVMPTVDLEQLRDEVRAYLANHPDSQTDLADQIGISHSWLNKFINGQYPNLGVPRLNLLVKWVDADRKKRSHE
jgi:hypothetical protein